MARRQGLGESLEHGRAGFAALVDILDPVLRDRLERRGAHFLVVRAEFDNLHALRLDLFGAGLLALLESLAALAGSLSSGLDQLLTNIFRQPLEFRFTHGIGEDGSAEV